MSDGRLVLASGPARLSVSPADGGRFSSLVVDGHELLVTEGYGPIRWGCYPMVPFAGRIRDGRFTFRGRAVELPRNLPPHAIHGKLVEELWEHFVKPGLERPTFVMDFPVDTSPLVREHRTIPGVVEKWDLYVRGFELATGYSELVDPVIQRERFVEQAKLAARGDLEAMRIDEEFLRALEHGMPPTGGMGMGIDRLLMAITGLGIRETILFPLVK